MPSTVAFGNKVPPDLRVPSEKAPGCCVGETPQRAWQRRGKGKKVCTGSCRRRLPVDEVLGSPAAEIGERISCHHDTLLSRTQRTPRRWPLPAHDVDPQTGTRETVSHASGVPCGPAHGLLDLARAEPGAAPSQLVDPRPLSGHTGQACLGSTPCSRSLQPPRLTSRLGVP